MKSRARKVSSTPNRIYTYGSLAPTENADLVEEQYARAYAYQNRLIEIETARRIQIKERELSVPVIRAVHAEAQSVSARAEALFHASRVDKERLPAFQEARAARKAAWKTYYEVKKKETKVNTALQEQIRAVSRVAYDSAKEAYNAPEAPFWGTALLVNLAVEAAKQAVPLDGRKTLRFRDPEHDPARLGVQLQGGLGVAALGQMPGVEATDRRLQLVPNGASKGGRRQFALLRLRVGSCGPYMRDPVWAVFPVIVDRPLPPDAIIKYAWVRRWRVGLQYRYALQLTLEAESFRAPAATRNGAADIHLGLVELPGGALKVADVNPLGGGYTVIVLPAEHLAALRKVSDLVSIQSRLFTEARDELAVWLETVPLPFQPAFLVAADLKALTHRELRELAFQWKSNRFPGDASLFEKMDYWRHRSRHLYGWEANLREQCVLQRNALYEKEAVRLARMFGEIRLIVGEEKNSFFRQHAAMYHLQTLFKRAAAKYGAIVVEVKASAAV